MKGFFVIWRQMKKIKCSVCNYPYSELHHMAERHIYNDNEYTVRLCPNCHSLFHMIKNALYESEEKMAVISLPFFDWNTLEYSDTFNKIKQLAQVSKDF